MTAHSARAALRIVISIAVFIPDASRCLPTNGIPQTQTRAKPEPNPRRYPQPSSPVIQCPYTRPCYPLTPNEWVRKGLFQRFLG
jgi:hypothetical protein